MHSLVQLPEYVKSCIDANHKEYTKTVRRSRQKQEKLSEFRSSDITSSHQIYPTLGRSELIEFELKNPMMSSMTINIDWMDTDLRCVCVCVCVCVCMCALF